MELTILMPCLNEAATIRDCVAQARAYLESRRIDGEVLVADNCSSDGSDALAATAGARVIRVAAPGYGHALRTGIEAAKGRYVIMGDADRSYDFSNLDPIMAKLRDGYPLVMGNRFQGGIRPGAMPALHRFLGNPVLSGLGRLFFRIPIRDFHCGLRGFDRQDVGALGLVCGGMEFASEMVVKASLAGLAIAEVPVTLYPDGRPGASHLRSWRDGWRHLRFLLLYSPAWLFLYPGLFLVIVGLLGLVWLLPGPRAIGGVEVGVNTLVYCTVAIITGWQTIMFYCVARIVAARTGLLPRDPILQRFSKFFRLETGIAVGMFFLTAGLIVSLVATLQWGERHFGPLDPTRSLRLVVPGAAAIIFGLQMVFGSFLFSFLELRDRSF